MHACSIVICLIGMNYAIINVFLIFFVLCVLCVVFWGCICLAVNSVCDKRVETLYLTGKILTLCFGQLSPCFR